MADRHHYVAKFHLRAFTDPVAIGSAEPWLWVADCKQGTIKRRSPTNFGWSRGLYSGPGGLADRDSTLESFLAKEVEGPAASALRSLARREPGAAVGIPPALSRYLAWAAARSLPMKALYQSWIDAFPQVGETQAIEPPPPGLAEASEIRRVHRMEHSTHGVREDVPSEQVELLRSEGWHLRLGNDDFLELVHLQAWYFQVRFFPRLQWLLLHAPIGKHFIIGDRPVVWGFAGHSDVAPSALRNPLVQLAAPLSGSLALFAHHALEPHPEVIMPNDINRIVASGAHDWIAGPTESVVREALSERIPQ
jgi:hypothetical protein